MKVDSSQPQEGSIKGRTPIAVRMCVERSLEQGWQRGLYFPRVLTLSS